jgi:hypothetical protein
VLVPGQTKTVRFTAAVDHGSTATFTFQTDAFQQVAESNETNNTYSLSLSAPPKPVSDIGDLVIADAYFAHTPSNGLYWLVVTLRNNGLGTVTICESSWTTRNVDSGLSWAGNSPGSPVTIPAGQTWVAPYSAKPSLPQGAFTVTIEANYLRSVPEPNYANNLYSFTVQLPQDIRPLQY